MKRAALIEWLAVAFRLWVTCENVAAFDGLIAEYQMRLDVMPLAD